MRAEVWFVTGHTFVLSAQGTHVVSPKATPSAAMAIAYSAQEHQPAAKALSGLGATIHPRLPLPAAAPAHETAAAPGDTSNLSE